MSPAPCSTRLLHPSPPHSSSGGGGGCRWSVVLSLLLWLQLSHFSTTCEAIGLLSRVLSFIRYEVTVDLGVRCYMDMYIPFIDCDPRKLMAS